MPLEMRKDSRWWYGRFQANGKFFCKNLGVEVRGTVPSSLKELGDPTFERSRTLAEAALKRLQEDLRKRTTSEELVQTIHEIRTGDRVHSLALAKMPEAWTMVDRHRPPSTRYLENGMSKLGQFIAFMNEHYPIVREMADVQTKMARDFLKSEADRGVAPKTYNATLILLRSCFDALRKDAGVVQNPFEGLKTQVENVVYRKPFSETELGTIVEKATDDPFIRPIIVAGICTAMRRGDCCLLKWEDVDLKNRFITVKTSKTGEMVSIPLFPLLHEVLWKSEPKKAGLVFPEQAKMYQENPDGITWRVRQVLRKAGFFDADDTSEAVPCRGAVHEKRPQGLRKASVRDFHSFRVTWVTLALTAGVPLELVQKVTGHRTAHIVMKHYFQPGREDFRRALTAKLPKLIGGGTEAKPLDRNELEMALRRMTPATWKDVRDELLARVTDGAAVAVEASVPA